MLGGGDGDDDDDLDDFDSYILYLGFGIWSCNRIGGTGMYRRRLHLSFSFFVFLVTASLD